MVDLVSIGLLWFDMVRGLWFVVRSYGQVPLGVDSYDLLPPKINGWLEDDSFPPGLISGSFSAPNCQFLGGYISPIIYHCSAYPPETNPYQYPYPPGKAGKIIDSNISQTCQPDGEMSVSSEGNLLRPSGSQPQPLANRRPDGRVCRLDGFLRGGAGGERWKIDPHPGIDSSTLQLGGLYTQIRRIPY